VSPDKNNGASKAASKRPSHQTGARVSGVYAAVRAVLIARMAKNNVPTAKIAETFGVNRSYVIRIASLGVPGSPRTADENRIHKLALDSEAAIRKAGLGFVFSEGVEPFDLAGRREKALSKAPPKAPKTPSKASPKAPPVTSSPSETVEA
jgi:hypothetical protein